MYQGKMYQPGSLHRVSRMLSVPLTMFWGPLLLGVEIPVLRVRTHLLADTGQVAETELTLNIVLM